MRSTGLILFWLLLMSCEMVTEIDIPEFPRKAVVNAIFIPDSTWMISISISKATQPKSPGSLLPIQQPQVILTDESGQQIPLTIDDRPYDPFHPMNGIIDDVVFRSASRPEPGMTYRIDVTAVNAESATATAHTPYPVPLIDVKLDSANMIVGSEDYSLALPIEFTFEDPGGEDDYYYPVLIAYYSTEYTNPVTGEVIAYNYQVNFSLVNAPPTSDLFDFNQDVRAIKDDGFDGQRHTEKLYVLSYYQVEEEADSVRFYMSHAGNDYVQYFRTMDLYNQTRDNPFAEPVQIYTNVEGGLGIFAGTTASYWDFK